MFWSIGSLGDCVRRVIALTGVWWVGGGGGFSLARRLGLHPRCRLPIVLVGLLSG